MVLVDRIKNEIKQQKMEEINQASLLLNSVEDKKSLNLVMEILTNFPDTMIFELFRYSDTLTIDWDSDLYNFINTTNNSLYYAIEDDGELTIRYALYGEMTERSKNLLLKYGAKFDNYGNAYNLKKSVIDKLYHISDFDSYSREHVYTFNNTKYSEPAINKAKPHFHHRIECGDEIKFNSMLMVKEYLLEQRELLLRYECNKIVEWYPHWYNKEDIIELRINKDYPMYYKNLLGDTCFNEFWDDYERELQIKMDKIT